MSNWRNSRDALSRGAGRVLVLVQLRIFRCFFARSPSSVTFRRCGGSFYLGTFYVDLMFFVEFRLCFNPGLYRERESFFELLTRGVYICQVYLNIFPLDFNYSFRISF